MGLSPSGWTSTDGLFGPKRPEESAGPQAVNGYLARRLAGSTSCHVPPRFSRGPCWA